MTHGVQQENIKRRLTKLITPIFIEILLIMILGAADAVMLSHHPNNGIAAVEVINQIIMLISLVFEVVNLDMSMLCSQYLGTRPEKKVVQVVSVSLFISLLVGGVISVLLSTMARIIPQWMGLEPELVVDGMDCMRIVGASVFLQAISLMLSASLRNASKVMYPMLVTVIISILSITGNHSLIFGKFSLPEPGVEGAAISTAFSRGVSMVILFIILFRKHIHHFPLAYSQPLPFIELKNLMRVGLPSVDEQFSYSSSQIVTTFFISMLEAEALTTRTYCANIIMFVYLFNISMTQGGAVCIGHLIRGKEPHAIFLLEKYTMKKSIMTTLILSYIIMASGRALSSWLTSSPRIIRMGVIVLLINVVPEIGRPTNIFATSAPRTAGDVNYPFYIRLAVTRNIAVDVGYSFGTYQAWGTRDIWVAFVLDENIREAIFVRCWYRMRWANKGFVRS